MASIASRRLWRSFGNPISLHHNCSYTSVAAPSLARTRKLLPSEKVINARRLNIAGGAYANYVEESTALCGRLSSATELVNPVFGLGILGVILEKNKTSEYTVADLVRRVHTLSENAGELAGSGVLSKCKRPFIIFVLGGPGSGKGTQCAKIVETYGFVHLSAGDLLRREITNNTEYGSMILNTIKEGKIVPSEVTVELIKQEMESSNSCKFLIDGFPRTDENRMAFERIIGAEPNVVLFFDCPEDEMVKRVLNRNQGRVDDNMDAVRKRLEVFSEMSLPVVDYYSKRGKLQKIKAVGNVNEIFEQQVRPIFAGIKDLST